MGQKSDTTKKLKAQLDEIGKEINERINRLDKFSIAIKKGNEGFETALANKQSVIEAKFRKSLMSTGDEVWNFAWDNVWNTLKELKLRAPVDTIPYYEKLEKALEARKASQKVNLKISEMWGDQVWTEVWNSVWKAVESIEEEYKHHLTADIEQINKELPALLDKQLALQTELEAASKSQSGFYGVLKKVSNSAVKRPSN